MSFSYVPDSPTLQKWLGELLDEIQVNEATGLLTSTAIVRVHCIRGLLKEYESLRDSVPLLPPADGHSSEEGN